MIESGQAEMGHAESVTLPAAADSKASTGQVMFPALICRFGVPVWRELLPIIMPQREWRFSLLVELAQWRFQSGL